MPYENLLTAADEQWLRNISDSEDEYQKLRRAHLADLANAREAKQLEIPTLCPHCGQELELQ